MDKNYYVISLISKDFLERRSRIANFAYISKNGTTFIKTSLKDSKKIKKIRIMF